jgi:hypothetical protein
MPIKSILDQNSIADLAKVNADQGRLGGLLKFTCFSARASTLAGLFKLQWVDHHANPKEPKWFKTRALLPWG